MKWSNGLAVWTEQNTAFISVAFSWKIYEARRIALYYRARGYIVHVGGTPLVIPQNRRPLEGIAEIGGTIDALPHHNPLATIASRGCPRGCWFCIVPLAEGRQFALLPEFVPRPVLLDSNAGALPAEYQNHIIEKYQITTTPLIDVTCGFEPASFTEETYRRWKTIYRGTWRFAFDEIKEHNEVEQMARILRAESSRRKQVYVLIGNEPIETCYERVRKVIEWKCEPFCQPVLPLNAISRDQYLIRHDWTREKLQDFARWSNRHIWRSVPLSEYRYSHGRQFISLATSQSPSHRAESADAARTSGDNDDRHCDKTSHAYLRACTLSRESSSADRATTPR